MALASADDMCSQDDQVSGDMGSKQAAKAEKADHVSASGDHAEHEREEPQRG